MRLLTLKLNTNDAFALIRIDIFIFVTIVKAKNDPVCLKTIIKYKGYRRNNFKAFE